MSAIGGSIESIAIDARVFSVAADADSPRKLGGFENEMQANGDGSARVVKTRMLGQLNDLQLAIDDDNGDQEFLQEIADRNTLVPVTITYASGAIYTGNGQIIGEVNTSSQNTTASVSLHVETKLVKQ